MANAVVGRVLLIPKGDYASGTTYNMLDLVRYNNKSWVCKQNCTGQTPQEDSYWQLMASDGAEGGYCYIRYSANSDGTGFVGTPTESTIYIGFYTGDSETAPTDKAAYTWSKFMGADGQDGVSASASVLKTGKVATITCQTGSEEPTTATISDGEDGEDGASINLAGEWYVGTEYVNNGSRIDIVSKSGNSYGCLQSHIASNTNQPPNSSYWQLLAQKGADGQGSGDMLKSTYDTNGNGMVDMAESLNGLSVSILELNYMDGATGNVQEQLDDKLETETDPTVPSWAKQAEKPSYTASEVGAAETEHTHDVSDVTGLQNTLDAKQPLTNNLTAETAIADADTIPFFDSSANGNRKSTWANIVSKLKEHFDEYYNKYVLPMATTSTLGGIKPDGTTITVNEDGVASSAGASGAILDSGTAIKNNTTAGQICGALGAKELFGELNSNLNDGNVWFDNYDENGNLDINNLYAHWTEVVE